MSLHNSRTNGKTLLAQQVPGPTLAWSLSHICVYLNDYLQQTLGGGNIRCLLFITYQWESQTLHGDYVAPRTQRGKCTERLGDRTDLVCLGQ